MNTPTIESQIHYLITGIPYLTDQLNLSDSSYNNMISGDHLQIILEKGIENIIHMYNHHMIKHENGLYMITDIQMVVIGIKKLSHIDKLPRFEYWLENVYWDNKMMYDHLRRKWISAKKNISLWYNCLDANNRRLILESVDV